ncbi:DUF2510 domain-containing protein [Nocardia sp. Marseille-Q1738]
MRADIIETATAARGTTAPPNWYPDPEDEGLLRYWNGTDWTGDRKPVSAVDITGRIQQRIARAQRSRCSAPVLMRNDNRRSWPTLTSSRCRASWPASVHPRGSSPGLSTCPGFDASQPSNSPNHHLALKQFDLTRLGQRVWAFVCIPGVLDSTEPAVLDP